MSHLSTTVLDPQWSAYDATRTHDELLDEDGSPRSGCEQVVRHLKALGPGLADRQAAADDVVRSLGITFTAWAPPSGLHPSLPIDSPLTFDVVDRWTGRSLGGCRYHVVHPGGRSYETFPVNAVEAESRRQRRFESMGHTPGRAGIVDDRSHDHPEYPATLDLRRIGG